MNTNTGAPREFTHVIGVVGAASRFGAQMLLYLEKERPDSWLVAIAERPLRWPVERISTYRLAQNRVGGVLTMSDIPDFMQQKAWDMFLEGHELTIADIPDVLQLEGVDSLIHVGSYYDGPNPEQFCADAQLWLRAARIARVRQFIYLSDVRVYGANANNPVPITERTATNPSRQHRYLAEAEPALPEAEDDGTSLGAGGAASEEMKVAVLRAAMSVSANHASPATEELLLPAVTANRKRSFPLQFLHQHDLARAIEQVIRQSLHGVFNMAGDGVVDSLDILYWCRSSRLPRHAGSTHSRNSTGRQLSKHPLIVSSAKFKQMARFRFKYSSARAIRAYCHSVLLEPA